MIKIILFFLSTNLMALTPQREMLDRLETIEDKYFALDKCNLADLEEKNWEKILSTIANNLDTVAERCLLDQKTEIVKEKNRMAAKNLKLKDAKNLIIQLDCESLSDNFQKSLCIIFKETK